MTKKKKTLWAVIIILIAVLVALAAFYVSYFVLQVSVFDRSGWNEKDGAVRYLDYYGRPITGWQTIEGKTYYLGEDGNRATGWQTIDGQRYYLGQDGSRKTGWQQIEEDQYYFSAEGQLQTGMVEIGGNTHYLTENGTPYVGWADLEDGRSYYQAPYGEHRSNIWLDLTEGQYYLDEAGHPVTGWQELDGGRYYFSADGVLDKNWNYTDEVLHYTVDGVPHNGWYRGDAGVFYFTDGVQKTGWITDETGRFYLYEDGTYATGFVTIDEVERYFLPTGEYILLCNRWNYVPDDFELNLVTARGAFKMDASAADALNEFLDAAKKAGYSIEVNNTYRSNNSQKALFNRHVKRIVEEDGWSWDRAWNQVAKSVLLPGQSEHNAGLAADLYSSDAGFKWMNENCWKYGFILRYPNKKSDVTGIKYEPWHFRYVGVELAKEIMESGLCLEEYLEALKNG